PAQRRLRPGHDAVRTADAVPGVRGQQPRPADRARHPRGPAPAAAARPRIPRDLETIVLKAIAKEPGERYPSAAALAEGLRRFLADRRVQARRSSRAERAWRWCRRNPVVAGLTAAVACSLLLGTAVSINRALVAEGHRQEAVTNLYHSRVGEAQAL